MEQRNGGVRPHPFVGSELPEEAFQQVRQILLQQRGFDLALYKDRCIKRRIAARVRALGLAAAEPYIEALRLDEGEVETLLAALTINVSQFFRNPSAFAVLESRVLPELLRRAQAAGRREVRLWSAGCAGGEEPYSLALLADELALPGVTVSILGTDVNAAVLERAREGVFDSQRLAEVPTAVRERYFTPEGRSWRLAEPIRRRVEFRRHNLLAPTDYPAADLILCRNVLIYFSRQEQEQIVRRFAAVLPPGGYLGLGKAETLMGEARRLFAGAFPAERIYLRA